MTDGNIKQSLEKGVMDAIHSGRVHMRPRWKFVLSGLLAALGVIILLFTLLFIASFSIFEMRENGTLFMPLFGLRGWFEFFAALPLILVFLLIVFLVVLEVLVRRYRVGYRTPLLISVLAIFAIVTMGGYAIERTRVHEDLLRQARLPGGLPTPIQIMYRSGSGHVSGVYRGTIVGLINGGFVLSDDDGDGTTTVIVDPGTHLPGENFQEGEDVVVFGQEASGTIHAFGIREISD